MFIARKNLFKLVSRIIIFFVFVFFAVFYQAKLIQFFNIQLTFFKIYHLVWFFIVLILLKSLFIPSENRIASGKIYLSYYKQNKKISSKQINESLNKIIKQDNKKLLYSALFWLFIVIIYLIFYFAFGFDGLWIYGFVIFSAVLDAICIVAWCPFRNWIIKNKCCNNCRIYNGGYWMIFIPLIVLPSFWNYSLIFLSILILIKWEYFCHKYSERIYEISNLNLACKNCKNPSGFCKVRNKFINKNFYIRQC